MKNYTKITVAHSKKKRTTKETNNIFIYLLLYIISSWEWKHIKNNLCIAQEKKTKKSLQKTLLLLFKPLRDNVNLCGC